MSFHEELLKATEGERNAFIAIPLIQRALRGGVERAEYLAFLEQAYHHVKHTCRLLALALSRCDDSDGRYMTALVEYLGEERGHEAWILDDIAGLGGDPARIAAGAGAVPTRAMVAYVYYAILHEGPYAMLGMIHVLEGLSATFASTAARALQASLNVADGAGFSYLRSHGELDQEHVAFFSDLVDAIQDPAARHAIVETARVVYRLYGDIFREIDAASEARRAA